MAEWIKVHDIDGGVKVWVNVDQCEWVSRDQYGYGLHIRNTIFRPESDELIEEILFH